MSTQQGSRDSMNPIDELKRRGVSIVDVSPGPDRLRDDEWALAVTSKGRVISSSGCQIRRCWQRDQPSDPCIVAWIRITDPEPKQLPGGTLAWSHLAGEGNVPDPGEGYRFLGPTEGVQEGDEYWSNANGRWMKSVNYQIGCRQNESLTYRRRIDKDPQGHHEAPNNVGMPDPRTPEILQEVVRARTRACPRWHDEAPPTVDQVGNLESRWITLNTGELVCLEGKSIREWWHDGSRAPVIAWHDQEPPEPYQIPQRVPTTWQKTAERPPTEADTNKAGKVATITNQGDISFVSLGSVLNHPEAYVEWIPTAALINACRVDDE